MREEFGAKAYDPLAEVRVENGGAFRIDAVLPRGDVSRRLVILSRGPASGRRILQLYVDVLLSDWPELEARLEPMVQSFAIDPGVSPEVPR
jgi:hypothetical protein